MNCFVCEPDPNSNSYLNRKTICLRCYEGAQSIILFINKTENDKSINFSLPDSYKGFEKALKWMAEMMLENEKKKYSIGFATALRDQIHTDIHVMPGDNEPPIPAHRVILATRSTIFRNMLESDECKAPANKTITLPELSYEELDALLEFLYSGSLPKEKMEKHVCSLAIAADKYEIPFLQKFCENEMLGSLNSSNALDTLKISDTCSNQNLKDTAISFIVRNMKDVVFSPRFEDFVLKNPHLSVLITRATVTNDKN
ncbi:BTB/POZ domain-containing protein At1g01640-like [Salvia splendens]|uniref:BTB/POZ domain-containing protein At1g01640-like n=1 Tax=Salvia splendens TaxID=180675 RepID=UPI001C269A9A|nr:BTB/POZ domain-containing protein At1g01640-like [Salvia splendens]